MFSGHCFKENCQCKLFAKWLWRKCIILPNHALEHLIKPSAKRHNCIQLYFKPAEEIKQPVILKLIELKNEIKIYRKDAIAEASKIINNFKAAFEKYLDQINEFDKRCSKIIDGLINDEEFLDIASENDIESALKLNLQNAVIKMNSWSVNRCRLDYKHINEAISEIYEVPFNHLNPFRVDEIESNELSFFRKNTSNFATINLDNFEVSSTVTLDTKEKIAVYTSKCILPDKAYFYCCNPDTTSGMAFMIDKNKNVIQLQKSKVVSYLDPVFHKDFIYLIGGNNKLVERYNFNQDCWESIAPLSQDLNFNNSYNVLFGDLILITGYYLQKIISYSAINNKYTDIPNLILENNCPKLMMRGNNRVYLFEKGKRTFESAENDISKWTHIGNNNMPGNNHIQSVIVRYKGCLYSIHNENKLWRFDLSSKQLSEVKVV